MAQYLPQKPASIPLIAAVAANSHFLFANIGVMVMGVVPYVLDHSPPGEIVKATNWFIEMGKNTFFPPALASSALFGFTAYSASDVQVKRLSAVASVAMFGILPWTVAFMLPINRALVEMERNGKDGNGVEKVRLWRARHGVRMVLAGVGWVAGVLALERL